MSDLVERQAAIDAVNSIDNLDAKARGGICINLMGLPPAQPEQRWIPCSKQLPRQGQEVICQCRADMIKVLKLDAYGDWYQDATHCYMGGFVIAWMPLPEPYRGVER